MGLVSMETRDRMFRLRSVVVGPEASLVGRLPVVVSIIVARPIGSARMGAVLPRPLLSLPSQLVHSIYYSLLRISKVDLLIIRITANEEKFRKHLLRYFGALQARREGGQELAIRQASPGQIGSMKSMQRNKERDQEIDALKKKSL